MRDTQTRWPRMQGFPWQMLGSTERVTQIPYPSTDRSGMPHPSLAGRPDGPGWQRGKMDRQPKAVP